MRELNSHVVTESDKSVRVVVLDEANEVTKAHHEYNILLNGSVSAEIRFQKGPVHENELNGITGEALLAIVKDRLECFQQSQYSCRENAIALTKIDEALLWLESRTRSRMKKGIEGTRRRG